MVVDYFPYLHSILIVMIGLVRSLSIFMVEEDWRKALYGCREKDFFWVGATDLIKSSGVNSVLELHEIVPKNAYINSPNGDTRPPSPP